MCVTVKVWNKPVSYATASLSSPPFSLDSLSLYHNNCSSSQVLNNHSELTSSKIHGCFKSILNLLAFPFHFSDTPFAFLWIKPLKMGIDLESLSEATSGAIGALVSTTILYPLDTCKTKYQAEVRTQHQQKYRLIFFPSLLTSWPHISLSIL